MCVNNLAIFRAAVLNLPSVYMILHLTNPLPIAYVTTITVGLVRVRVWVRVRVPKPNPNSNRPTVT